MKSKEYAMKNRNEHNKKMQERLAKADLNQAELETMEKIITGLGKGERDTAEVVLPGDIRIRVYTQMNGELEELFAKINTESLKARAKKGADLEMFIKGSIKIISEMCVAKEIDGMPTEKFWRAFHRKTDLESIFEILEAVLKPYMDRMGNAGKFRRDRKRKKTRSPV